MISVLSIKIICDLHPTLAAARHLNGSEVVSLGILFLRDLEDMYVKIIPNDVLRRLSDYAS